MQYVDRPKFRENCEHVLGPHDIWSMDFVFSRLSTGARLQVLTVVDVITGYVHVIDPRRRQHVERVIHALHRAGTRPRYPGTLRICPGSELDFPTLRRWAYENGTTLSFSQWRIPSDTAVHHAFLG
jgi:transposase InsO family protein